MRTTISNIYLLRRAAKGKKMAGSGAVQNLYHATQFHEMISDRENNKNRMDMQYRDSKSWVWSRLKWVNVNTTLRELSELN